MNSFKAIYKDLLKHNIEIDRLIDWQPEFLDYANKVISGGKVNIDELKAFLRLCLDYYTYSNDGKVLIPDHNYDLCMNRYYEETGIDRIHDTMYLADDIAPQKKWDFIEHSLPGLVGTINDKLYSYDEVRARVLYYGTKNYAIAPKYDGISVALKLENRKLIYAATRYDGYKGQNITALVKKARFPKWFKNAPDGYYKCEILMNSLKRKNMLIEDLLLVES